MRPEVGEVLHFSEDPSITRFVPHVAQTAAEPTAFVWAVNAAHAPSYWFPRQCPRAMAWVTAETTAADRARVLGPHATRVHMVEYGWLKRIQAAQVSAYRFDATEFEPYGASLDPHAFVARHPVRPIGPPELVGDLLKLHDAAQIELRLGHSLWPWWEVVTASTVGFSGIRLRNAGSPPPDRRRAARSGCRTSRQPVQCVEERGGRQSERPHRGSTRSALRCEGAASTGPRPSGSGR